MKIFDFILENKHIIFDKGLFDRDTFIMIRAIVSGKLPNNFKLSQEQEDLIVEAFLESNNSFNEDTPSFLLKNEKCIRAAIMRNINSVNYIENVPDALENYIVEKVKEHKFILNNISPSYLKSNYEIAYNSIKYDSFSANFINWDAFDDKQINNLITEALQNGYILTDSSCEFLTKNLEIVLESIKVDKENIKYASETIKHHPSIFKYLLLNGYPYTKEYIKSRTIDYLLDEDVMNYCFKWDQTFGFGSDNEKYISRFTKIYHTALNSFPLVSSFASVFQMEAEEAWKEYRNDNIDYFENIFGKICTQLRNYNDFDSAITSLKFWKKLKETLEEKYDTLCLAMKEYFNLYHSDTPNKLEKVIPYQDVIAEMAALYVSKSKENYKKNELEEYYDCVKPYFTLRLDQPFVYKKLIQCKKKDRFKKLLLDGNQEICNFLTNIVNNYSKMLESETIQKMIQYFVIYNNSKFENIIDSPNKYEDYQRYEKAIKLVHRLNSGYIEYNGVELTNYRDIIAYDGNKRKYIYTGISFHDDDLKAYNEYRKKERIFEKIKKDIMLKIKTMEIDDKVDSHLVDELTKELPFTDEYFKFNEQYTFSEFNFQDFLRICTDGAGFVEASLLDDESFQNIIKVVSSNALFWLLLFMDGEDTNFIMEIETIIELIDNMKDITELSHDFNFDLSNFQELVLVNEMSKCADAQAVAILGKEVIEKLYKFRDYTDEEANIIISMAEELVCQMTKRSKSTVPYVNGQTDNYKYSIYDSQDDTLLLAGINTDACFRINGNDNDFLHYCALDKNGFVIKITDLFGNFVGRGSGFRNGNCVFINQLRTIYDECGNHYNGTYVNEREDIIKIFQKACEDIVTTSHKNHDEKNKIDFVFVTKSYSLQYTNSNVSNNVTKKIGDDPMDNESDDWREFVSNTDNLSEARDEDYFETDYGSYPLICMASAKQGILEPRDIKFKDVSAIYERRRNQIIVTTSHDLSIINKLNKINGVKSYLSDSCYHSVEIPENATIFTGDNWYIVFDGQQITSSSILDFDEKAKVEFEAAKTTINQYVMNQQQFSLEQVVETLQSQIIDEGAKVFKLVPHVKR